ncbi:MAG: hypothetical protein Q7T33_01720 [Dehalococcoidia bacterium]|nr:hypothetical protein [Dehalococcoidia bacterium]
MQLAATLWNVIVSKALQSGLSVDGVIDVEEAIEEQTSQLVLRVKVHGIATQALAFWSSLDADIDRWMTRLPDRERNIFLSDVGLRFAWAA